MRILVLANFGMGLYNFRKELLKELIKNNHEVFISLPKDEYKPKLEEIGCEFIDTPVSRRGTNPITDFKLFMNYKKIIKEIKPDIVLTYTIKPNVYGGLACRVTKTPCIVNITGLGTAVENGGVLQRITLYLYRISLKKVNCVFFQNEENKKTLIKSKAIVGKNMVLPGSGVNLEHYNLMEYPKPQVVNFLFISRIMKEKGIDQYLEAASYLKQKYSNVNFHIVGFCESEYKNKLTNMQDKGVIEYHGKQSDVKRFYEISHCTVHPSYYPEGMSNVLLESAACGRPIITTNRSGCGEVVDEGVNGYKVKPENSNDLIEKMEKFLNLSYETKVKMGLSGRRKVEIQFNRRTVIDTYLAEIHNITER
ncbi:glycosyltransferase [Halobacillus halophilus]|uniref:glycosyltransferase family 4 protein n=1 Tax=Halobacillus halophilus TaxID=1570 RepID=UPI00136CEE6D|nr:glycosyltransferase family 4 protein [Halobacillus halophilus]MYL30776.1 glycosyltransferase [Halobacillus halophilus]